MKFELMSPAGNWQSFLAAVESGADAVYFGLKQFNMRNAAKNFTFSDINKMQKYKIKKYLTLNTIIYDNELNKLENIIKKIKGKVDAIICWDLSVINLCKKHKIPFHISTQASISNTKSAEFYKKLGAKRINLARELNINQIKKISKIIDTEIFIHGALCVAVSGRCFTSQFLHKRSANRGQCMHPCRKSYTITDKEGNQLKVDNNYIMSAKDLCSLPFIEQLKKAGVKAFKIEGRNRNADYVEIVTKVYREAIDNKLTKSKREKLMEKLKLVYNRKFSSGFYIKPPTSDDFTDIEGSNAKIKKKIVGKVKHYYKKSKVAIIQIFTDKIKLGDQLVVTGNKTGTKRFEIKSMEINHKKVSEAKKSQLVGVLCPLVRKNDDVFKYVKK